MDKNKIYRKLKWSYTEKQVDEILDGKEIADVWEKKEKKVKKAWNKSKKEYNKDVLRDNRKKMKSYKFTKELDEAIVEKSYELDSPIKKLFASVGLSTNTYFACKRRWVISPRSLYKIKKIVPEFDFSKIVEEDNG